MTAPLDPEAPLPGVRPLEANPVEQGGEQKYVLQDPAGFAAGQAVVPPFTLFVMSLLDGTRNLRQLQAAIQTQTGHAAPLDRLEALVRQLDEALLLDSPRFHAARNATITEFRAAATRPALLAGASYPADPGELTATMDGFFVEDDGPGALSHPAGDGVQPVRGVLAPHLDFPRGRLGYAHAYQALAQGGPPELVVVLAVAHASPDSPFVATAKDFETPFGTVATDRDALALLQQHVDYDLTTDEYTHRGEHSAEFQAVWLRHCFPPEVAPNLTILPILCSSFAEFVDAQVSPQRDDRVRGMILGLQAVLAAAGDGGRLVGGVDLSHMGPRYGDSIPMGPDQCAGVERFDRKALAHVWTGDGEAWFAEVAATGDRSKICGLSAIYTFCEAIAPGRGRDVQGRLLRYGQVDDPTTPSIVSYCAAEFRERPRRTPTTRRVRTVDPDA